MIAVSDGDARRACSRGVWRLFTGLTLWWGPLASARLHLRVLP